MTPTETHNLHTNTDAIDAHISALSAPENSQATPAKEPEAPPGLPELQLQDDAVRNHDATDNSIKNLTLNIDDIDSRLVILLCDMNILCNAGILSKSLTTVMLFLLKFNSVKALKEDKLSTIFK